jgi:hypothetical protein
MELKKNNKTKFIKIKDPEKSHHKLKVLQVMMMALTND